MSIHEDKARRKASNLGAWAGHDATLPLWRMSKRELVELSVRLGARAAGRADSIEAGVDEALGEYGSLKLTRII